MYSMQSADYLNINFQIDHISKDFNDRILETCFDKL